MSGGDGRPWDPGLAALRTTLSWQRSAILVAVVAAVLTREALAHDQPVLGALVGGGLLVATIGLYAWRGRLDGRRAADPDERRRALQALTAVAVLAGACSLLVVLAT